MILYAGCLLLWDTKLQTEIALSTAEAEYIALYTALRELIHLLNLLEDFKRPFNLHLNTPNIKCTVFEDNQRCIAIDTSDKFTPLTKHIALKYHHFRDHVKRGVIDIQHIDTADQIADILTKSLDADQHKYLRKESSGW